MELKDAQKIAASVFPLPRREDFLCEEDYLAAIEGIKDRRFGFTLGLRRAKDCIQLLNKKGIILCGYQGIGKSTLCRADNVGLNCIDLESSNFFVDGERPDIWFKCYAQLANHLAEQGYTVFTVSHKIFRDYMKERGITFMTISPAMGLKDAWIKKLEDRYEQTKLEKDYKAMMNAKDKFVENILDLQSEPNHYIITTMDYVLEDVVTDILCGMMPNTDIFPNNEESE